MNRNKSIALAFAALILLSASGWYEFSYVMSQAPGQIELLFNREPIVKTLKSKDLDPATRAKLELALDVKKYSEEKIGLVHNKSYTLYRKLDRDALSYNLTATPKLSLKPLSWSFPVVGSFPYLGFFKKEDALKKQKELEAQGYDVYVRKVSAYSLLGYFPDPLYSTMLKYDDADLANTIIHELTHGTVWAKGYPEFNENLALFVGNQGSLDYCVQKFGKDSEQVRLAIGSNEDDVTFQDYLHGLEKELNELYSRKDLTDAEKLKMREQVFARTKEDFKRDWLPKMKTDYYKRWTEIELNNAVIASRLVYYHDLSLFYKVYEKNGSDLQKTVAFFKQVATTQKGNPEENLKKWLQTNH
jgi:predicted aminopeptidase